MFAGLNNVMFDLILVPISKDVSMMLRCHYLCNV